MPKLILIMVDGISAEYFERIRHQLPNLDGMARDGCQIGALTPEICGTSFPGRASMIVGEPPSVHGIYGNAIWDGEEFRWSNPYDVRVPSIASHATAAGLDVASLGFGMVKPEDCALYKGPWWVDEMMMRGRDEAPHAADEQWRHAAGDFDSGGRLAALGGAQQVVAPNAFAAGNPERKRAMGMLADHQLMDLAGGLATSAQAPDLILLEIGITDYFLHSFGDDHPMTEWSLRTADAQIGTLRERLRQAGRLDDYHFAVMSDHGHAPMRDALFVDRLLGEDVIWSSEGGMLLVKPADTAQAERVAAMLAEHGVERWDNEHLPTEQREQLLTFSAPADSELCFERSRADQRGAWGVSKYQSNHGMRPGTAADHRFCVFSGPRVPNVNVSFGEAVQVAPTLAAILDVPTPWAARPLFEPI